MNAKRVAVTGIGVLSPLGNSPDAFFEGMLAGRSGIGPITHFDTEGFSVRFAGEVKGFDSGDFLAHKAARRMDRFSQLAVGAAQQACDDAGFQPRDEPWDSGVVIASGIGGLRTFEDEVIVMHERGPDRISPFFIPMEIPNMASGQVSLHLGAKGPSSTTTTACAAGSHAIGDSFEIIRRGAAKVMLAGGSEAPVTPVGLASFGRMGALSTRNDSPTQASCPFDERRDGFVIGEGASVLVLEEWEHALARSAHIYAEVLGYGMTSDAYHITNPDPSGEPAGRAMAAAMAQAGVDPEQINYISAHATSTPVGDRAEAGAISWAFGAAAHRPYVGAIKSMIGHCLGAAGALSGAACVLSIEQGRIPAIANLTHPDTQVPLNLVRGESLKENVKFALSNSFGFGGHNVSLLFGAAS